MKVFKKSLKSLNINYICLYYNITVFTVLILNLFKAYFIFINVFNCLKNKIMVRKIKNKLINIIIIRSFLVKPAKI